VTLNGRNVTLAEIEWFFSEPTSASRSFLFLEIKGICGYSLGFLGEGASNDSGVVEESNFQRLLLAICWETLHRISSICVQHIQSVDGFSVISK